MPNLRGNVLNDSELVQGLRKQEPAAFQLLCDCYLPSLWRFVYSRINGDQHLAEDISSETVLALLAAVQSEPFVEITQLGGWLRTVAGRRIADHFRAVARVRNVMADVSTDAQTTRDDDPVQQNETRERREQVRRIMDQLSDQFRLALEWKYIDRLSVREMSERWSTTEKAAESILFRARGEFRRLLKQDDQPDTPIPADRGRTSRETNRRSEGSQSAETDTSEPPQSRLSAVRHPEPRDARDYDRIVADIGILRQTPLET